MSKTISVNDLDYKGKPKLIFTANTPERKGLANKSYSIELPYTTNNGAQLPGVWSGGSLKPARFEATYTLEGVRLTGYLNITSISKEVAKAVFVSGNGSLWQRMEGGRVRDIDMSDGDIELTKANVIASETGNPLVVFDVSDRGAFKTANAIDITDRYPALNLVQLLTRLFNEYGAGLTIEGLQGNEYLLFTQESEIRNSNDWKKDAIFEAEEETVLYELNTQGAGAMVWEELLDFTATKNDGAHYILGSYEVPETGTYRFKIEVDELTANFGDNLGGFATLTVGATADRVNVSFVIKKNGTAIYTQTRLETILSGSVVTEPYDIDTLFIELEAGDDITAHMVLSATVSFIMGADESRFTNILKDGKLYNQVSRWYGAGSTVEIKDILPDVDVLEFIQQVTRFLNADLFFDAESGQALFRASNSTGAPTLVECFDMESEIDLPTNTLLEFATDKALPPDNYFINISGADQTSKKLDFARTLFTLSGRLGVTIPTLWQSGNPTDTAQYDTPPELKTRGTLRILRKAQPTSASYVLTFGGNATSNSETISSLLTFTELDIYGAHIRDEARVREVVTATARLEVAKLRDLTYFKNPIQLIDRRTGALTMQVDLLEAAQLDGNLFRLTGQSRTLYNIDVTDNTRPFGDTNTFTGSSGGGGGTQQAAPEPLPADVWQSSIDGQISGLDAKTTPVDDDTFVIDDSADDNSKKRVSFANIKKIIVDSSIFGFIFENDGVNFTLSQATHDRKYIYCNNDVAINITIPPTFGSLGEMYLITYGIGSITIVAGSGVLIINSDPLTIAKRYSVVGVKQISADAWLVFNVNENTSLKTSEAGQINAITAKSAIANNDKFIIEDSSESYIKKSLSWTTILSVLSFRFFDKFVASQIEDLAGKTTPVDADVLLIEDSAGATPYSKQKLTWANLKATLKTYFDTIYKWEADTNGVKLKTNTDNVGIGGGSTSGSKLYVTATVSYGTYSNLNSTDPDGAAVLAYSQNKGAAFYGYSKDGVGIDVLSDNNSAARLEVRPSSTNSVVTILKLIRNTVGTAAANLGGRILFSNKLSSGSYIDSGFIESKILDTSTGTHELKIGINSSSLAFSTDDVPTFSTQVQATGLVISDAGSGTNGVYIGTLSSGWRQVVISGNLVFQKWDGTSWVTKETIS
jgi:hypothetical protein